ECDRDSRDASVARKTSLPDLQDLDRVREVSVRLGHETGDQTSSTDGPSQDVAEKRVQFGATTFTSIDPPQDLEAEDEGHAEEDPAPPDTNRAGLDDLGIEIPNHVSHGEALGVPVLRGPPPTSRAPASPAGAVA